MPRTNKIFDRMKDFLPPCFNTDPQQEKAIILTCTSKMKYKVENNRFTTRVEDSFINDINVDLTTKTIDELATYINAISGYTATVCGYGDKTSTRLVEVTERENDGNLYAFKSVIWAFYKALSMELEAAHDQMDETIRQMTLFGATGIISDYTGSFYKVTRKNSESDARYAQRILWTIMIPKANNIGMEDIIKKFLNLNVRIIDMGAAAPDGTMLMNNVGTPFHSVNWVLWNPPFPFEPEAATFGIYLLDKTILDLTAQDITDLRDLVYTVKTSGTCPKIIWKGEPQYMKMNNTATPFQDTDFPLWTVYQYKAGFLSLIL